MVGFRSLDQICSNVVVRSVPWIVFRILVVFLLCFWIGFVEFVSFVFLEAFTVIWFLTHLILLDYPYERCFDFCRSFALYFLDSIFSPLRDRLMSHLEIFSSSNVVELYSF